MRDWTPLLEDSLFSWRSVGPGFAEAPGVEEALRTLRGVVSASPEVGHRPSMREACAALRAALESPASLQAAFADAVDAARVEPGQVACPETEWCLAVLADIVEANGRDWGIVAQGLGHVLEGFDESGPSVVDLADPVLAARPEEGRSVVWLAIDHAYAWGPSADPAVQLFEGDWLLAVLREDRGRRDGVPEELVADPDTMLTTVTRVDDDASPGEKVPVVLARVDLGDGPVAGARIRAREALEALVARASVAQGGTYWKVGGACLHYLDGRVIYSSIGPIGDPDVYNRLTRMDVLHDRTAELVHAEVRRLGGRLPWHDNDLSEALELARWLSEARTAPGPARLALSGRTVEQGAHWAGLGVVAFVDVLLDQWCVQRVAERLAQVGRAAVLRLPGGDGTTSTTSERDEFHEANAEIIKPRGLQLPFADPVAVLRRLSWLCDRHNATTEIGEALLELRGKLSDGPATVSWLSELRTEGARRNARAVRTRNMVVHGGPIIREIVPTVVDLQDWLAHQALDWAIEAHTAGPDMPALVIGRRDALNDGTRRLRDGAASPVHVLPDLFSRQPDAGDETD
jgi:hypothetical protein